MMITWMNFESTAATADVDAETDEMGLSESWIHEFVNP
jgi:hypothetical protein